MIIAELVSMLSFKQDEKSKKKVDKTLDGFTSSVKGLKTAVAGFVGAMVTGLVARQVNDVAKQAEGFIRTSQAVGITTKAVQELSFAFTQNGASASLVDRAMRRITTSSQGAADGGDRLVNTYRSLGLSVQDLDKMGPDETFMSVAEGISQMTDEQDQLNAAVNIFGTRMATDLMPVLKEGGQGLEEVRKRANELGMIFDDDQLQDALEYNNTMGEFTGTLDALKTLGVLEFLPFLTEAGKEMTNFVVANRDFLKVGIKKAVDGLAFGLRTLMATVRTGVHLFTSLTEFVGGANNAFKLLAFSIAAITFAKLIVGLQAMGTAGMIAWLKMMAPIVLLAVGILGIILVVEDFLAFMDGEGSLLGDIFGDSAGDIAHATALVGAFIVAIIVLIGVIIGWPVALAVAIATLIGLIWKNWDEIKQATSMFLTWMGDAITGAFDSFVDAVSRLGTAIWDPIKNGFVAMIDFIKDLWDALVGDFSSGVSRITGAIGDTVDGAKNLVNRLPGVQINSPNREEGLIPHIMGNGEDIVAAGIGGGAQGPQIDLNRERHQRENQRPISDRSIRIDSDIVIEGSNLTQEELSQSVSEGLIGAADLLKSYNDMDTTNNEDV